MVDARRTLRHTALGSFLWSCQIQASAPLAPAARSLAKIEHLTLAYGTLGTHETTKPVQLQDGVLVYRTMQGTMLRPSRVLSGVVAVTASIRLAVVRR